MELVAFELCLQPLLLGIFSFQPWPPLLPFFFFLQEAFYQQVTHTLDPISYALLDLPQVLVFGN